MKLSAKSRYGLKAMYFLAKNKSEVPLPLKTIAKFTDVSSPYLEKLLGELRRKNLVKTTRGANGGYSLNLPPSQITVGLVVRALEGEVLHVKCVNGNCTKDCASRAVFNNLYNQINNVLDGITIQSMLEE